MAGLYASSHAALMQAVGHVAAAGVNVVAVVAL
jgi:hypothetical protein